MTCYANRGLYYMGSDNQDSTVLLIVSIIILDDNETNISGF